MGVGLVAGLFLLAGCDNGGSAVETRPRVEMAPKAVAELPKVEPGAEIEKPVVTVTANRRETADAKVERLFARNGEAFGAQTADDYLSKVQDFTRKPPKGTEVVKRANGDTLFYQASTNTFAVIDRAGVPRTMFKPDNGPAYWQRQKDTAPTFGQRRNYRSQ